MPRNLILIGSGTQGGIQMQPLEVDSPDADIVIVANIVLGGGGDFVCGRGEAFGVQDVVIAGGAGNEVFDIQSGTGIIDGVDDIDSLVLAGNFDDFDFYNLTLGDAEETSGAVRILDDGAPFETDMLVRDVDFFQFDDQIVSYTDLYQVT